MTLQDIQERVTDTLKVQWLRFQESSSYEQLQSKYDDLTPSAQKAVQVLGLTLVVFLLVFLPFSWISSSSTHVDGFESSKDLIRSVLQVKRDLAHAPQVPLSIPTGKLKAETENAIRNLGLRSDQVKGIEVVNLGADKESALIPATITQEGVLLTLWKINLTQFVDMSYQLQRIDPNAKLLSIDMKANSDDVHYYDAIFQLVSFSAPFAGEPEKPSLPEKQKGDLKGKNTDAK